MLKFVSTKARRAIHLMTRRGELEVQLVQLAVPLFCFVVGLPGDYRYINAMWVSLKITYLANVLLPGSSCSGEEQQHAQEDRVRQEIDVKQKTRRYLMIV